jgi:hypothetical protein
MACDRANDTNSFPAVGVFRRGEPIELDQGTPHPAKILISNVGQDSWRRCHDDALDVDNPLIGWFVRGR